MFVRQYRIKKREHLHKLILQKELHEKEILTTKNEIQKQTMQHIGREIHDNIGQKLTLASLYAQQISFTEDTPIEAGENLTNIINNALLELRQLSKNLTDASIEKENIVDLLRLECRRASGTNKCNINFKSNREKIDVDYESKNVLLRISQEFIQNSLKHAQCKTINLIIKELSEILYLNLSDDGKGFDINAKHAGIGLTNIKNRTSIIGGKYVLESNKNGTNLEIKLPLMKI